MSVRLRTGTCSYVNVSGSNTTTRTCSASTRVKRISSHLFRFPHRDGIGLQNRPKFFTKIFSLWSKRLREYSKRITCLDFFKKMRVLRIEWKHWILIAGREVSISCNGFSSLRPDACGIIFIRRPQGLFILHPRISQSPRDIHEHRKVYSVTIHEYRKDFLHTTMNIGKSMHEHRREVYSFTIRDFPVGPLWSAVTWPDDVHDRGSILGQ